MGLGLKGLCCRAKMAKQFIFTFIFGIELWKTVKSISKKQVVNERTRLNCLRIGGDLRAVLANTIRNIWVPSSYQPRSYQPL